MEKICLDYSRKNIPIPSRREYEMLMMGQMDKVMDWMRWRAWHVMNPGKEAVLETFGFRTTKASPAVPELKEFEYDFCNLLKNIKFVKRRNDFQQRMSNDLAKLKEDDKVILCADKTNNMYKIPAGEYMKNLTNEITAVYTKR